MQAVGHEAAQATCDLASAMQQDRPHTETYAARVGPAAASSPGKEDAAEMGWRHDHRPATPLPSSNISTLTAQQLRQCCLLPAACCLLQSESSLTTQYTRPKARTHPLPWQPSRKPAATSPQANRHTAKLWHIRSPKARTHPPAWQPSGTFAAAQTPPERSAARRRLQQRQPAPRTRSRPEWMSVRPRRPPGTPGSGPVGWSAPAGPCPAHLASQRSRQRC